MASSYIVVYLDLVGYSKNNDPIQVNLFKKFQKEIHHILYEEILDESCVLIPTGDGIIVGIENKRIDISYLRSFDLVTGIIRWTKSNSCNVRCSIHVGDVNILKDINRMKNIVGNTINDASRILSGSNDGGIIISKLFFETFLVSKDYKFGKKIQINDSWHYVISDEDTVIDKHSKEHNVYNIVLYEKDIAYGSLEKILTKYSANIYSTEYPKKKNLTESFFAKVESAVELDFIGIYNPSLPHILEKLDFSVPRHVNITILYASDKLTSSLEEFFGSSTENLDWKRKAESLQNIVEWHSKNKHKESIQLKIFEYDRILPFGASMVDKGIQNKGFIHVSNYFPKVLPALTPYIEVEWKTNNMPPLFSFYSRYLKSLLQGEIQPLARIVG